MSHESEPDLYAGVLSKSSSEDRETVEERLDALYAKWREASGIDRLKLQKQIDRIETQLAWQGANPKEIPIDELAEHIRQPMSDDATEAKYRQRISNRATAIRAYCVWCQGGGVADVKACASLNCPLHPFRMGADPLRGWQMPEPQPIENDIEEEDDDLGQFEDDNDDTEDNAAD